ncbi:MAG: DUF2723 domain-containing protein, partial [Candidatus Eremiobacteraeota bacterium]|nr:DUF2723 domain-containing protein [Candidatus Eremiobacteraeota bacterium]
MIARGALARSRTRCGLLLFGIVAGVYVLSFSRDVGFWDYGELQTVPYILGLAHTTGFPTEILSGWLFSHLVAVGSVAFRITLFCWLCGVGAALCCYAIALELGASAGIAVACAAAYACMRLTWSHAASPDVVNETVLLSAATLLCATVAHRTERRAGVGLAALLAGLSLGTHATAIFALPTATLALLRRRRDVGTIALAALFGIGVAAIVYGYLPLRSCAVERQRLDPTRSLGLPPGMPIWDWGGPCKPADFIAVVTGRQANAGSGLRAYLNLRHYPQFFSFALTQLGSLPLGALLVAAAVLAFLAQPKATHRRTWVLFLPFVLVTPFAAGFGTESDVARYYMLPGLCLWIQIAVGCTALAQRASARRIPHLETAAIAAVAVLALAWLWQSRDLFERRNDRLGSTYVAGVIAATSDDGILIAPWVDATPLAYAAYAEKSFGRRFVVFGDAAAFRRQIPRWAKTRAVYE